MKIGTDITNIHRIEKSIEKFGETFKKKFLNSTEIERAKKIESIAGLWAAKESIAKALGCGIGKELSFHDITIFKDSRGTPYFRLSPNAQIYHKVTQSSLSISHDSGFAIAVVMIETK